jgi:hypothetical protein
MISMTTNLSTIYEILAMKAKGTDLMHGLAASYNYDENNYDNYLVYWINDF